MSLTIDGLIPAIVQDYFSGQVLMLGYQNQEAYDKTAELKEVYFYSRSRQKLWLKGESSGNKMLVKQILPDCDQDTVLILAVPTGPVCHTGHRSCFYKKLLPREEMPLASVPFKLEKTIASRKKADPDSSYTAQLFRQGLDRIAQKVGEEAVETIIAAKNNAPEELVSEIADLIYHVSVLLVSKGMSWANIHSVLLNRMME